MRVAYLVAGIVAGLFVLFNGPRLPWIPYEQFGPVGIFRGFSHGMIGFSYQLSWALIVGGVYQVLLGVLYWDMDTRESLRWQFALEAGLTARLLWVLGALCLVLGVAFAFYAYTHDHYWWPCGIASTVFAWLTCWLMWLAFPLYEQVGIDREEVGV